MTHEFKSNSLCALLSCPQLQPIPSAVYLFLEDIAIVFFTYISFVKNLLKCVQSVTRLKYFYTKHFVGLRDGCSLLFHWEQWLWSAWIHVGHSGFHCWQGFTARRRGNKTNSLNPSCCIFLFSAVKTWPNPPPPVRSSHLLAVCLSLATTFTQQRHASDRRKLRVFRPIWWKYECLERTERTDRAEVEYVAGEKFLLMFWYSCHHIKLH